MARTEHDRRDRWDRRDGVDRRDRRDGMGRRDHGDGLGRRDHLDGVGRRDHLDGVGRGDRRAGIGRRDRFGRPWLGTLAAAVLVVAAGLATARLATGAAGDALGDALYAALVLLLVTLVLPGRSRGAQAGTAIALCWAVELAQLTGVPAAAAAAWPPLRYVLGTTFVATDLLWYAVGVLLASAATVLSSRWGGARRAATTRG